MIKAGRKNEHNFTKAQKSNEFFKIYFCHSGKGIWLARLDKPLPVELPIEKQEEHMLKYAYLAECNLAFVKMYGYDDPKSLIGIRFPQLFDNAELVNMASLRTFLREGYRLHEFETVEIGKNGIRKYFLNDVIGIVEEGYLIRIWGTQKDITEKISQREILKQLSPEQLKVLKTTVEGKTMKEIAFEVGVSLKTIESIRKLLKSIFGVDTVAQLIASAIHLGITTDNLN
jgi:DNA-binding CsgD family transcriptional regulator